MSHSEETRDLDLLAHGDSAPDAVLAVFQEVLSQELHDGIRFESSTVRIDRTRRNDVYGGFRIRATAEVAGARIVVLVGYRGFGDALEPPAEWLDYPVLLDMPAPRPPWLFTGDCLLRRNFRL